MSPEVLAEFNAACRAVQKARGDGLSLSDLAACHALARELTGALPDPSRLTELRLSLGIESPAPSARPSLDPQTSLI